MQASQLEDNLQSLKFVDKLTPDLKARHHDCQRGVPPWTHMLANNVLICRIAIAGLNAIELRLKH